ncbi:MAG: mechanosensitive ion channel [Rhodothermaceae bacterium]|nr:mechanosensitive ion channel [Rhodothermaceae bacterium]
MDQIEEMYGEAMPLFIENAIPVILAIIMLYVGYIISKWAGNRVNKACDKSPKIDDTLSPLIAKTVKFLILIVVFILVLDNFGMKITSFIAILGAAGLAIGLALQGTLSNVASGVMLLSLRPFRIGDFIVAGDTSGVVDEISLFTTLLHTPDNVFIMVPNSSIWNSEIKNFSRNDTRRNDMVFGIGYSDDIDKAMGVLNRILEEDERVLKDPAPMVAVSELGDSSVDFVVRPWCKKEDYWALRFDIIKKVKQTFDKQAISIPFPQRDVHLFQQKN